MTAHFHYSVTATFDDVALRAAFEEWMLHDHIGDVMRAGDVLHTEMIRFDGQPLRTEVRYLFSSREAFARYEAGSAEKLRAEGREKFPFGVTFVRGTGLVVERRVAAYV